MNPVQRATNGVARRPGLTLGALAAMVAIIATVVTFAVSYAKGQAELKSKLETVCRIDLLNNADLRFLIVQHEREQVRGTKRDQFLAEQLLAIFKSEGKASC